VITGRDQLDITSENSIAAAIDHYKPWAVINAAGFVRVEEAEQRPDECFMANVTGAERLARACKLHGLPFITFSSDQVFDGRLGRSYLEPDPMAPSTVYGRSKAEADARVIAVGADTLIIRTSSFFGPWDDRNFAYRSLAAGRLGQRFRASETSIMSPTYVPDLVHAALDLLLDEESGIWHLTNEGALSWLDFARQLFERASVDPKRLLATGDEHRRDTSLSSQRGLLLRPLDQAIDDFVTWSEPLRALA
jgi:dTDP-4-dehydrorhamnose reductase